MSDAFDARLERLFAQPPRVADPDGFARRVETRLDREWSLRRSFIGIAGLAGGVIAVAQVVGAETYSRVIAVTAPLTKQIDTRWATDWSTQLDSAALLSGQTLWIAAALGGLVATLAITRVADAL